MKHLILRHNYAARITTTTIQPGHSRTTRPPWTKTAISLVPHPSQNRCRSTNAARKSPRASSQPRIRVTPGKAYIPDQSSRTREWRPVKESLVATLDVTRPPPLDLPEPPHPYAWPSPQSRNPSQWDIKYMFRLGKAYVTFYKDGLKRTWANWKLLHQVRRKVDSLKRQGLPLVANLSWYEYEFEKRAIRDLRRLLPFSLVVLICGEFTPLVILWLGARIVPGTCVIPKQETDVRNRLLKRGDWYTEYLRENWETLRKQEPLPLEVHIPNRDLVRIAHNDFYPPGLVYQWKPPSSLAFWPFVRYRKLHSHYLDVLRGAEYVTDEGGWERKSPRDMYEWGNEYGMYMLRKYISMTSEKGLEPISEDMKTTLMPIFKEETEAILKTARRSRSHLGWSAIHSCLLYPDRIDSRFERDDLEHMYKNKSGRLPSEIYLSSKSRCLGQ